jgi:hypothetical protein
MIKINNDWIKRNCPLCGLDNLPKYPEVKSSSAAESLTFIEVSKLFIGIRKDQVFFSYYRCKSCRLLYCPWYFSQSQLDELYAIMPDNSMGNEKKALLKTQNSYVKKMSKNLYKVKSYLEIGPDIGLVSSGIIEKYHPVRSLLIEPNLNIHQVLKKNTSNGNEVRIATSLSNIDLFNPDLTVGVHVYDHLLLPSNEIRDIFERSENNSTIAIVIHNESSFLRKMLNKKWPPFCLQHPQIYNKKTIRKLLMRCGWSEIRVSSTTNWYYLDNLLKLASNIIGLNNKVVSWVPKFQVPIKLGNIIVVARKGEDFT